MPTTRGTLKWVCWPGLVHDRVFLEAIPILCLSSLWFQWSLFVEGMKERKIQRKRWDLRENEGKKEKKKCSEIEREETLPSKTNTFLPHTILGCSYSGVAVERKTIFETKFYLLSLCGYMVKKEPHHTTFFLFFVKATQWITFGLWILGSLLQTII